MKKILWIFASAILLSNLFISTGCGDDTTTTKLGPLVSVTSSASLTVEPGAEYTVTVKGEKGDGALSSLKIQEDGALISIDRVVDVDNTGGGSNTNLVTGTSVDGFTWDIKLEAPAAEADYTITFILEDANGLTDNVDVALTVKKAATALTNTIKGSNIQLWNQAGPAGRGGIDLDDGSSTGTKLSNSGDPTIDQSYLDAELRDMGIDSLAGSGDNWRRRVASINGTNVRFAGNTSSLTDFNFDNIVSKEAVKDLYDKATDLSATLPNWGSFKVSNKVAEGDIFVVYKSSNSTYYLVVVNSIVETTTLADNTDHYVVSIKY
ncbi:MAG: hypothetical protein R2830_03660 [Saprospiraceae bacterium]